MAPPPALRGALNQHGRRMVKSIVRRKATTPVMSLSIRAYEIVTADLAEFGSRPDEKHKEALMRIVGMFTRMAYGEATGRFAFPLPTGCGKTQSIVAWITAVHQLRTGHSVVVAASKVEDLCDIHRKLISKGVPEDAIGIIHSKAFNTTKANDWLTSRDPKSLHDDKGRAAFASLPSTVDNDTRQFLLVTHARVQSRKSGTIELLNTYRGKRRDICIWDESLIVSQSRGVSKMELDSAFGWFSPRAVKADQQAVLAYIDECRTILAEELEEQRAYVRPVPQANPAWRKPRRAERSVELLAENTAGRPAERPHRSIRLPFRTELELSAMTQALGNLPITKALRDFLAISQGDLRVVAINQGGGAFVTYDIVVPAELRTVAILDASYAIRELEQMDTTIHRDPGFDGDVKLYDTVSINHLRHGSGRSTMEKSFQQAREDRKVSAEICDVVSTIPVDEGIIIFTFKQGSIHHRAPDIGDILKTDLRAAGIDVDGLLPTQCSPNTHLGPPEGTPTPALRSAERTRFRWLTWGQETSISDHKDCTNVHLCRCPASL